MKSKKSIYILLPVVLFIWGAVIYQFFSFSTTDVILSRSQSTLIKQFKIKPKDTFNIKINPRDPFLGMLTDTEALKKHKSSPAKSSKLIPEIVWPDVQYKGIVSDTKEKIKVYMVLIDGKTYLMKKGAEQNGVRLKDGDRQTIYAVYKGDLKVVFIH